MKAGIVKRLENLESKHRRVKSVIAIFKECEKGVFAVSETVYCNGVQLARRDFDISAEDVDIAASKYQVPEGCEERYN